MQTSYFSDLDKAISDLNDEIKSKLGLEEFIVYINERYWVAVQKRLKIENITYKISNLLEKDQLAIIVNKKLFDEREKYGY